MNSVSYLTKTLDHRTHFFKDSDKYVYRNIYGINQLRVGLVLTMLVVSSHKFIQIYLVNVAIYIFTFLIIFS